MKTLFDAAAVEEIKERLGKLGPTSERQWGKMTAPQMVAHCSLSMQWATGEMVPEPAFIGLRVIGRLIKPLALKENEPLRRNSPTAKSLIIADERDLVTEREKLRGLIARFAAGGPAGCTKHPHSFFGPMKPEDWATLMYKHLDHHLRQFGV